MNSREKNMDSNGEKIIAHNKTSTEMLKNIIASHNIQKAAMESTSV